LIRSVSNALSDRGVSSAISHIVEGVKSIGEHISDMVSTPAFGAFLKGTFGALSTVLGGIVSLVRDITGALTDMGKNNDVAKGIGGAFDTLNNVISKTFGIVRDLGKTIGEAFADSSFGDTLSHVGDVIGSIVDKVSTFAQSDTLKSIASTFAELSSSVLSGATSGINTVVDALTGDTVTSAIKSLMDNLTQLGQIWATWMDSTAVTTSVTAVLNIFAQLYEAVSDVFTKGAQIITQFFTSADFTSWGDALGKVIDVVKSFLDKALEPIQDSLDYLKETGVLDWMWDAVGELGKQFGRLMELVKPVTDFLGWLAGAVLGKALEGAAESIGLVAKAIGSLVGWLLDMVEAIGKLGSDIFGWVKDTFFGSATGESHDGAQYASYGNYSSASTINNNSSNAVHININPAPGMDVTSLARQIRHEVELGLA
jgi:hypothetical protein